MGLLLPIELFVLTHCYIFPEPIPNFESQSVQSAIKRFIDQDLICVCTVRPGVNGHYPIFSVTPKGHKFMEMLCDTPLPVLDWKDPRI